MSHARSAGRQRAAQLDAPRAGSLELTLGQRTLRFLNQEALAGDDVVAAVAQSLGDPARGGTGDPGRAVESRVEGGRPGAGPVGKVAQPGAEPGFLARTGLEVCSAVL